MNTRFSRLAALMLVAALAAGLLAGCINPWAFGMTIGSGRAETREFDFADFTEVEAGSAFRVTITPGDEYAVAVTVDDNLWDLMDVRQVGERVTIGFDSIVSINRATLEAEITMPVIEELDFSGASVARFEGFASDEPLRIRLSGASRAEGEIDAGDTDVELSGASRMTLAGSGGALALEASGASNADLEEYTVTDARLNLSGASRATVAPSGTLDVDASGASRVEYVGSPTMGAIDTSGASEVDQR